MEDNKILKSFKINNTLNNEIWDYDSSVNDKEPTINNEVKDILFEVSDDFINFLGVDMLSAFA